MKLNSAVGRITPTGETAHRTGMTMTKRIAAIIGGGVIGGGWAARFVLSGWDVVVHDPGHHAERDVVGTLERARRSYPAIYDSMLPDEGTLEFVDGIREAVQDASWIQESVPEDLERKREVYELIQGFSAPGTAIASSTSGFRPSDLQADAQRPGEIIVAHPFNPVYLLPAVEVVQSGANSPELVDFALSVLEGIGMYPLKVRTEIEAHLGDRLLEAAWREALWLVRDNIATTGEVDDVIRMGFGLRWAQMGMFETYRIAGGRQGMEHFMEQFGPCLKLPWTRLTDVPDLDSGLAKRIARQSDEQSGERTVEELEEIRDANLVAMMRGLKGRNWGVGRFLRECEGKVTSVARPSIVDRPMRTIDRIVPLDWADYNGHMNEAKYLELFSLATDSFLEAVGCDQQYVATGGSYFTLETGIRHLNETFPGERVRVDSWCLHGKGRKLHLYHRLQNEAGSALATGEHLLIHVNLSERKSSEPAPQVAAAVEGAANAHEGAQLPDGAVPKLTFGSTRGKT